MSTLKAIGASGVVDIGPVSDGAGCWSPPVIAGLSANSAHRASVQRTSLLATLLAARATPVVTLCAPTGFGKSTVLAQWAEVDSRPFPWLTLNESHNNPAQLLHDLAMTSAVLRAAPTNRLRLLPEKVQQPTCRLPSNVETIVGEAIGPFVLVLDNAHLVTERAALDIIGSLMLSMPPGSQLAIASRAPLAYHNRALQVTRSHLEITAADLAFDLDEARSVLGSAIDANTVRTTLDSCEGWPVVLDLHSIDGPIQSGRHQGALRRRDQVVDRFVRTEVPAELDESTLTFLTHTAVLDELLPGQCDIFCGGVDSGAILDRLRSRNLLVLSARFPAGSSSSFTATSADGGAGAPRTGAHPTATRPGERMVRSRRGSGFGGAACQAHP
jgi:LuxR family maltose regulon positive regulatory protein